MEEACAVPWSPPLGCSRYFRVETRKRVHFKLVCDGGRELSKLSLSPNHWQPVSESPTVGGSQVVEDYWLAAGGPAAGAGKGVAGRKRRSWPDLEPISGSGGARVRSAKYIFRNVSQLGFCNRSFASFRKWNA